MKKIIVGTVAVLAVAVLASPLYTGGQTKKDIEAMAASIEAYHPGLEVNITEYNKGYLTSTGKLTITEVDTDQELSVAAEGASNFISMLDNGNGATFDINANHGFIIFRPKLSLARGYVSFTMVGDNNPLKKVADKEYQDEQISLELIVSLSGNSKYGLDVPKFTIQNGQILFDGANIVGDLNPNGQFMLDANIGSFVSTEPMRSVNVEPITFDLSGQLDFENEKLIDSESDLKMPSATINGSEIKNLSLTTQSSLKEELIDGAFVFKTESIAAQGLSFSNIEYNFDFENIDYSQFSQFETVESPQEAMAIISKLLSNSPKFSLNAFTVDAGQFGNIDLKSHFFLDSSNLKPELNSMIDLYEIFNHVDYAMEGEFTLVTPFVSIDKTTIDVTLKDKATDSSMVIGAINGSIPAGFEAARIETSPISIISQGEWTDTIITAPGTANLSADSIKFSKGQHFLDLQGLTLESEAKLRDKVLDVDYVLRAQSYDSSLAPIKVEDFNLKLNLLGLSPDSLVTYYEASYLPLFEGIDSGSSQKVEEMMTKALGQFVAAKPVLKIEDLSAKVNGEPAEMTSTLALDDAAESDVKQWMDNPDAFLSKVDLVANAAISKALPLNIFNAMNPGSTQEDAQAFVGSAIEGLVEGGFVIETDDEYKAQYTIKNGESMVNDVPVPLPPIGSAY